jgi:L-alanine-DL-glutamate epimerase-like enolase superfamily enzyme
MLMGRDPRAIEKIYYDLYRITRQSHGGIVHKALAAIENALLDIKAKDLSIPVYELLGGPTREKIKLYWSHCGTNRVKFYNYINQTQLCHYADLKLLCDEIIELGYKAIKTNLIVLGDSPFVIMHGFKGDHDRNLTNQIEESVYSMLDDFKSKLGKDIDVLIDINMHFRKDGNVKLINRLSALDLGWIEVDCPNPEILRDLTASTRVPIASCEGLMGVRSYVPYFNSFAMDICLIDPRWNGVFRSKKIADLAEIYGYNVAPHNFGSPLSSLMTAHFCASITNLKIMEYDVDDVPWRDDTVTNPPVIKDGYMSLPAGIGWGADLNEEEILKHG